MTKRVVRRLAKVIRRKRKRGSAVLKSVNGKRFKIALVVALFALACAVETKAILALESSQELFKVVN
jgi:hypothetical protein